MNQKIFHKKGIRTLVRLMLISSAGLSTNVLANTQDSACAKLTSLAITNGKITEAHYVPAGKSELDPFRMFTGASNTTFSLPAHCLVRGEIEKRKGADGKEYSTRFEVRLPKNWHQRFIFQGGGGTDGFLANAVGTIPTAGSTALPALTRGYAVASMNGGHDSVDPLFGLDQQARLDYAYAAIGKVTHAAKSIIKTYYKAKPAHSYFMGCSNGGREAMIAAQRYPLEFNGVVAGNPGFHLSRASIAEAWDTQAFYSIAPKDSKGRKVLANALTNEDLKLVSDTVLKQCDAKDGLKDGIINNYIDCDFTPETLRCDAKTGKNCLSDAKVDVLEKVFGGAKDSKGNKIYSGWPYDAGISAPGWRSWKLGTSQPNALNAVLGAGSLAFYFMTPADPSLTPLKFNFDTDVAKTYETGALNDAVSTNLTTYMTNGGKMLVFQGVSDPVFSANDIRDWYLNTQANTSGKDLQKQKSWSRLFMVPGMTHCGGGPALDDFDPLTAIEKWVEKDQAPDYMEAKGTAFPGKSQPICAYPQTAHYNGKGDINDISSYTCK